jgi:hypothetical protein
MSSEMKVYPLRYHEYWLDFFRPEDAEGIADLFRKVYGASYPIQDYYDPEALRRENLNGSLISVVARTSEGKVIAHTGLCRSAPNPELYESGVGLVDPAHRKAGLVSELLRIAFQDGPRRFSIVGIWGEAVTNHAYVQQAVQSLGVVSTALEVDLMPAGSLSKRKKRRGPRGCGCGVSKQPLPSGHDPYCTGGVQGDHLLLLPGSRPKSNLYPWFF